MNNRQLLTAMRRAAWAMKGRLLAAGLIMGSALAMFVGIYSAIDSLFESRDGWYRSLQVADLELRIVPEDTINIPSLAAVPGVAAVEQRLLLPGHLDTPAGVRLQTLMVATAAAPTINQLRIDEGRTLDPAAPDEVVIERSMARHHGYKVGDRFVMRIGKDSHELRVRGIATSPEHLIASANPNFFLPSKGSLGVVYVPYSRLLPRLGYQLVNSLLVDVADGADAAQVERAALAALARKVTVDESLPLARQFGHLFLELDLGAFKVFVPAIVLIFVITALVITVFLMLQWIGERKAEIGVMMALGYRRRQIALSFALPVLLIGAVALLSGAALGIGVLYGFGIDYARALGLPEPTLSLRAAPVLQGLAGLVLVLLLATLLPLKGILRLSPREALRGQVGDTAGGRGKDRESGGVTSASTFLTRLGLGSVVWRYALRNLRRGRGTAVMAVVAVALSVGASLAYFVALSSFEGSIVKRFNADRWDVALDFSAPVWSDELPALRTHPGVTRVDPYLRGSIKLEAAGRIEPSLLLGIDPASPARRLSITAGRALQAGDRAAIVLERKTAAALGVGPGGELRLTAREKVWTVRVVGLFSGVLPGESYASLADAQDWFDMADQVNGSFVQSTPALVPDTLYTLDRVARVTAKQQLIDEFVHHLVEISAIVYLAFGFSLGVAVLFLFATTAYGVLRRLGEYSMLRTIGFADTTVLRMVMLEVSLVGAVGVLLAIAVGLALAVGLNGVLSRAWFEIDTAWRVRDLAIVLLPALLLFPLTALPPFKTIVRAGLVPSLRRRAFG